MLAQINNISDGAGAYFLISKKKISILIFSSTNYVLKKFPAAKALYKPNMVIYSIIQTAVSENSEKIKVREVAEFELLLPMMLTSGVVVVPYNTPLNRMTETCKLAECRYSKEWFKRETAFIHKKLMEFMKSEDPFQLRRAIGNIKESMA
jgi:hypothetical protein